MDMVFNVTFNNISVISWWSVLLVEERGVPTEKYLHLTNLVPYLFIYDSSGCSWLNCRLLRKTWKNTPKSEENTYT
jgi:hypothetical protein